MNRIPEVREMHRMMTTLLGRLEEQGLRAVINEDPTLHAWWANNRQKYDEKIARNIAVHKERTFEGTNFGKAGFCRTADSGAQVKYGTL